MDDEMQAQQEAQQAAQQAAAAESSEGGASDAAAAEAAAAGSAATAAGPRALARTDTGTSEPGSGSLPPGIGSSGRMASSASQEGESPLAGATSGGAAAPSLYVSAAPSVQLEAGEGGGRGEADVAATVLLELVPDGTVQLSILLPAAAEHEGVAEGEEGEEEEEAEGELPPELAGAAACAAWELGRGGG